GGGARREARGGRLKRWAVGALILLAITGAWVPFFLVPRIERSWIDEFRQTSREYDCCNSGRHRPACAEAWAHLRRAASGFGDPAYVAKSIALECDPAPEVVAAREAKRKAEEE